MAEEDQVGHVVERSAGRSAPGPERPQRCGRRFWDLWPTRGRPPGRPMITVSGVVITQRDLRWVQHKLDGLNDARMSAGGLSPDDETRYHDLCVLEGILPARAAAERECAGRRRPAGTCSGGAVPDAIIDASVGSDTAASEHGRRDQGRAPVGLPNTPAGQAAPPRHLEATQGVLADVAGSLSPLCRARGGAYRCSLRVLGDPPGGPASGRQWRGVKGPCSPNTGTSATARLPVSPPPPAVSRPGGAVSGRSRPGARATATWPRRSFK